MIDRLATKRRVTTNATLSALARSPSVRRFMRRIIDEHRHPLTREVFATSLAEAAANTFDLYEDDHFTIPPALLRVSETVARNGQNSAWHAREAPHTPRRSVELRPASCFAEGADARGEP